MSRLAWIGVGATGVSMLVAIVFTISYIVIKSPTGRLQSVSGLDLPSTVRFVWERTEREQFLGQGFTLHAFNAPSKLTARWLADCPMGFSSEQLEASGIWSKLQEQGLDGQTQACVMRKESTYHVDTIVISTGQIFHMALDR